MKWHISKEQYNELSDKQKRAAESYYRVWSESKSKEEGYEFWNVGRMIEYLDAASFVRMFSSGLLPNGQWVDIYGFNPSGTLKEEWCDKLWGKVILVLEEEVQRDPHRFLGE